MEFGKRVTVVEYDLTSGSDNDDRDDDQSYIYCSIARPLSPGNRFRHDGDAQQPNEQSSDSDDCPPEMKRARTDDSSRSSTQSSESSSESASSSSDQEESDYSEPLPAATTPPKLPPPVVISISSDDDQQEDDGDEEPEQPLVAPLPKQRAAYALRLTDLPPDLERFMKETKSFFTRPHSLERHGQKLATSTFEKTEERILCYLGYVQRIRPGKTLSTEDFNRGDLIEGYLDYLKEERNLSAATASNHASSLLYPLKYYHRQRGPKFDGVPLISQLRRTATVLQKQGDVERVTTVEDLRAQSKWLHWDEVLQAKEAQRCRFELAKDQKQRAKEARDLLILSLYTHLPPSRGLEVRTLELVWERELEEPFEQARYRDRNVALVKKEGGIMLHLGMFKTAKHTGTETIPIQVDSELCRRFKEFVSQFRSVLHPKPSSNYVFLNSKGAPFSSSSFTQHLQKMFENLTGNKVASFGLRSSFVTWAYSQSECDDRMKESLAACLRHSREQAQKTYDRRTANERKKMALELARRKAEEGPADAEVAGPSHQPASDEPEIRVGDFVGLVAEDSTLHQPSIFLGRVQSFLPEDQVLLLWYRNTAGGIYTPHLDGDQWVESKESLVPVKVAPAKGRAYGQRLQTSLRTIHKAVMDGTRES